MGPGVYGIWPDEKPGRAPHDAPASGPAGGLPGDSGETVAALPAGPAELSEKDRALISAVGWHAEACIRAGQTMRMEPHSAHGLLEIIARQDDVIRKQRAAISEALEECR